MNLINNVYNLAETIMKKPQWVTINERGIKNLSMNISMNRLQITQPKLQLKLFKDEISSIIIELVGSSINYCYWYGKSSIRPNGASCIELYKHLYDAFETYNSTSSLSFNDCLDRLIELLIKNRFPLIEERIYHINQTRKLGEYLSHIILLNHKTLDINELLSRMIILLPGFASDMFLKRASLFFIQLYRLFGWFEDQMNNIIIPADYHIPQILNNYNCIIYSSNLNDIIENHTLIPKNSIMECEIRAAAILVARQLHKLTKWNIADIDTYLFAQRKEMVKPFHLTITTDY